MNFYGSVFFNGGFFGGGGAFVSSSPAGKKRRRWQAEKEGRIYEFDNALEAQQFLRSIIKKRSNKPRTFRLPDVELFYDDFRVTNVVVKNRPVIEWFFGHDLKALEAWFATIDEDDLEVILLVT